MLKTTHLPAVAALAFFLGCATTEESTSSTAGTTATYYQSGGSAAYAWQTISASNADQSAVCVADSGSFTLTNSSVSSSGDTSSTSSSLAYGLDAAVLVKSSSAVNLVSDTVTTSGKGASGVFVTGSSSTLTVSGGTIQVSGNYANGAGVTQGGTLTLSSVTIATSGAYAGAVASGTGGGTISVTSGTVTATGTDSPAVHSNGTTTLTGGTFTATGAEAAVVEGSSSITASGAYLSTTASAKRGVLMYQSGTSSNTGTFSMSGGSLTATAGPLFLVTNVTGKITLTGVTTTAVSGVILEAGGTSSWGTSGSNGGVATLTASTQTLVGNLVTDDSYSSIAAILKNSSTITGTINKAALTLDASSTWTVTGTSYLTTLTDTAGISGTSITNIIGNGHTVYYDATLTGNTYLGGLTYTLASGGYLQPQ